MKIEIRFARDRDEDAICEFLRSYWRADHIFISDPELMRWQHQDPRDPNGLTFALAWCGKELLALLGFIPMCRFDPGLDSTDLALAIWKVRDGETPPGLGVQLLQHIDRVWQPGLIAAIGTSKMVRTIYQALGYSVGELSHEALFSPELPEEPVASGADITDLRKALSPDPGTRLIPLNTSLSDHRTTIDVLADATLPRKSTAYLEARFRNHPWLNYDLQGIEVDGTLRAVLVIRRVSVPSCGETAAILRIVDMIGDSAALARAGSALQSHVATAGCDYIDFMHHGTEPDHIALAGFTDRTKRPGLILPNYFEPFEARNIEIELAYKAKPAAGNRPVRLFRADSDQDRPNRGPLIRKKSA